MILFCKMLVNFLILFLGVFVCTEGTKPLSAHDNEVFNECASCVPEPTCEDPFPAQRPCPRICIQRYECDRSRGYIRNNATKECVLERDCDSGLQCGRNEYLNICASSCIPEPTCQQPHPTYDGPCILLCLQRCECDMSNGYIRDAITGSCIRRQSCPIMTSPRNTIFSEPRKCPEKEVINFCSSYCLPEPTCENPYPTSQGICPAVCVPRCECNATAGLIRDSTGSCIEIDQCSSCDRSTQIPGCLSCCNNEDIPTCRNPYPDKRCYCLLCNPGCVCAEGFVLDESTGKCIPQCDCPLYLD